MIRKTYHIYKADCFGTSRLYMESKWDDCPVFIHRAAIESRSSWQDEKGIESEKLTAPTLIKVIRKSSGNDVMVFHAQPSLPYVLLARLTMILFRKKNIVMVYDIHDLHEYERHRGIINFLRYSVVRHIVLGMLERVCFWDKIVRKMTVSEGLAREVSKKYKCVLPQVVRNIPAPSDKELSVSGAADNKRELMYFGSPDRMPARLMRTLKKQGLQLHLYGKDITAQAIIEQGGPAGNSDFIKIFDRYSPNEMGFLERYSFLILYKPDANKLNYRYSLPNKLFQALNSGLSVLVSANFSEMIDLFAKLPGAVEVIQDDEDLSAAVERASAKRGFGYNARIVEFTGRLHDEARCAYLKTTKDVISVKNDV